VPIQSWPIDQTAFTRITFVLCEPKMATDGEGKPTGIQATTPTGDARKWVVQAVFSQPSRFDGNRTESEVKDVTVTSLEDPGAGLHGEVRFVDLAAGAMDPEINKQGRVRGGRIFLNASGVQPAHGGKS
jgi:hypothetical protein